jgi:methionyl-tRNA formyltransferase
MRIVFFGTPAFAVPTLSRLLASPHSVVAVITQPDRPRGRGQRVSDAPVKALALEHGIEVLQPQSLARPVFEAAFDALKPDLGVVAAYGKILSEWLLQAPALGMINVHASLLPKYRGAAPVHRAIVAGERETGVTIMRVVKALDAGPMMARQVRSIDLNETSEAVEQDLARIGAGLLITVVDDLAAGEASEVPQNDAEATYAPRLTKEEGLIDFSLPAIAVHNRIRGLRPWPMAYSFLHGDRLVFHEARLSTREAHHAAPGICVAADAAGITIACGDGRSVDVLQLQREGKRVMSAREYLAGHAVPADARFG